jgi:hypothetical protein
MNDLSSTILGTANLRRHRSDLCISDVAQYSLGKFLTSAVGPLSVHFILTRPRSLQAFVGSTLARRLRPSPAINLSRPLCVSSSRYAPPPNPKTIDPAPPSSTAQPISPSSSSPSPNQTSKLAQSIPPKPRSLLRRLLKYTLILNTSFFVLALLGGGGIWVYYSYIVPAKTIYHKGKDGYTMAVGVYDSGKGYWKTGREWYGWMKGETHVDELPEVKEKLKKGWFA